VTSRSRCRKWSASPASRSRWTRSAKRARTAARLREVLDEPQQRVRFRRRHGDRLRAATRRAALAARHGFAVRCGALDGEIDRAVVDVAQQRQHFVEANALRRLWRFDGDRFAEDAQLKTDRWPLRGRVGHGGAFVVRFSTARLLKHAEFEHNLDILVA
jgi:hypothetical protein